MKLWVNFDSNPDGSFTKGDYLIRAANRMGLNVKKWKPNTEVENVLNIEPYTNYIYGSKWSGLWEIDVLCDRPQMSETDWAISNTVYTAVSIVPKRMSKIKKPKLLLQAIDKDIHKRYQNIPQEYDFVLCGTNGMDIYKERERLISLIKKEFTYKDYGKGHTQDQFIKNLNTAKVQWIRSMNTQIADGELAQRFFECLSIGPVLTNWVPDLGETKLIEGEDYLSYKDDKELLNKFYTLLEDKKLRNKIAESGRKKGLRYHTFENRLQTIFKDINGGN